MLTFKIRGIYPLRTFDCISAKDTEVKSFQIWHTQHHILQEKPNLSIYFLSLLLGVIWNMYSSLRVFKYNCILLHNFKPHHKHWWNTCVADTLWNGCLATIQLGLSKLQEKRISQHSKLHISYCGSVIQTGYLLSRKLAFKMFCQKL